MGSQKYHHFEELMFDSGLEILGDPGHLGDAVPVYQLYLSVI